MLISILIIVYILGLSNQSDIEKTSFMNVDLHLFSTKIIF